MNRDDNRKFIRKTEALVKPQDVTAISFLGDFNKVLPKKTQHKIMVKGSRKIPYMGFIIDPYCFFLSYKIKDTQTARAMLPAALNPTTTEGRISCRTVPCPVAGSQFSRMENIKMSRMPEKTTGIPSINPAVPRLIPPSQLS